MTNDNASLFTSPEFNSPSMQTMDRTPRLWEGLDDLAIALIGAPDDRRAAACEILAECGIAEVHKFSLTSSRFVEMPDMLNRKYDVVLVDLESDPDLALALISRVNVEGNASVLVYSAHPDPDLLMRCMVAGARECLRFPFERRSISEALHRAALRRPSAHAPLEKSGKLLFFLGAKGGAGATTVACTFALTLTADPSQKTLLIDLDLPLGDAALNLGLSAPYSVLEALKDSKRLDAHLLSTLLVRHNSGLWMLAAPGRFTPYQAHCKDIVKLLEIARQEFDNVVGDLGSKFGFLEGSLLDLAHTTYLVTQTGVAEMRNSNRLITHFFSAYKRKLEIVLNRHQAGLASISEEDLFKLLGHEVRWKIPNDYSTVRKMQTNGKSPIAINSPISQQVKKMCNSLNGNVATSSESKRSGWLSWKMRLSQAAAI